MASKIKSKRLLFAFGVPLIVVVSWFAFSAPAEPDYRFLGESRPLESPYSDVGGILSYAYNIEEPFEEVVRRSEAELRRAGYRLSYVDARNARNQEWRRPWKPYDDIVMISEGRVRLDPRTGEPRDEPLFQDRSCTVVEFSIWDRRAELHQGLARWLFNLRHDLRMER